MKEGDILPLSVDEFIREQENKQNRFPDLIFDDTKPEARFKGSFFLHPKIFVSSNHHPLLNMPQGSQKMRSLLSFSKIFRYL